MTKQYHRLLYTLVALFALATAVHGEMVRIVCWNIEWFPGRHMDAKPKDIGRHIGMARNVLKKMNPDILILEEIRDSKAAEALLKQLPGFELHVISGFAERPQQIVIASRYKAKTAWWEYWTQYIDGPPRGFSFAALELPDDLCLLIYGVHLKSNNGIDFVNKAVRLASVRQLVEHTKFTEQQFKEACPKVATLVCGDFNTNPDSEQFRGEPTIGYLLDQGFYWPFKEVPAKHRITWQGNKEFAGTQFDHFFTRNLGEPKAWVWENLTYASDHLPIQIEIDTDNLSGAEPKN